MLQITIVGAGYIGRLVAQGHLAQRDRVTTMTRNAEALNKLSALGANPIQFDLDRDKVTDPGMFEGAYLYYFAPPPARGTEDTRLRRFLGNLGSPKKLLLISTTGVYGDCRGAWVDETHPPNPQQDRAKRRLDAERRVESFCSSRDLPYVILRVPGIYGAERLPLARLRHRVPMLSAEDCPYTNRIHAQDLAVLCQRSMEKESAQGLFNVSDNQPSTLYDYFFALAQTFELPPPPVISHQQARTQLSNGMLSYLGESRRIDNHKLLSLLGYSLEYPTLEDGLAQCKEALKDN